MKPKTKLTLAAALGLLAGMNSLLPREPDRRQRESNRMPLTLDELAVLAELSGKEKKQYVKKLREKYKRFSNDKVPKDISKK